MAWEPILSVKKEWKPVLPVSKPAGLLGDVSFAPLNSQPKTSTQMYPDAGSAQVARLSPQTIAREAAQGIARTVGNVGITAGNVPTQLANIPLPKNMEQPLPFQPVISTQDSRFTRLLFGDKPLATIQEQSKDTAFPLVLGGIALDLAGMGGPKAISSVIKASTAKEGTEILVKMGVPEATAKLFAPRIPGIVTAEDAKTFFDEITNFKPPTPAVRRGVNLEKLLLTPEGKTMITKAVDEIKPVADQFAGKPLTHEEVLDVAKNSSKTLQRVVGREDTLAWEAALLRTRQAMTKAANDGRIDEQFIKDFITLDTTATDVGRRLNIFKQMAEGKDREAVNTILEAVTKVNKNAKEVAKAAEGVDFTNLKQAAEFYRKFVKPTSTEWLDLIRYNSMLSSPKTHIINVFSNLLNTSFFAPLDKALAGGLDFLGSKIGGRGRKQFAAEGAVYYKHYLLNTKKGFDNLVDVMRGKRMYTNLDTRHIPIATKGVKGAVVSTLSFPSRVLEGMDQFFMALGEGGEKAALQYRQGKGVQVDDLDEVAKRAAEYRLYRQKPLAEQQGYLLDAVDQMTVLLQKARNNENPIFANVAKFTVPFLQTPTNIFKQGLEYSPAGFATIPGAANKTEQLSKAILGSAVFAGAASLLGSGRITWAEPFDAAGKRDFRAAGQQPYSVKIGDVWYSYQKLPPAIAFPFAMVAAIDDTVKKGRMDEDTMTQVLSSIAKYGQFLTDQSYAKSVGELLASIRGGEESGISRIFSNAAHQLIPFRALTGWLARLTDPTQRKIDTDASFIDKQVQLLMLNYPGLSQKVPARLDAEGNPIPQPNPVVNALSPVQSTKQSAAAGEKYQNLLQYKKDKRDASDAREKELDRVQPLYDEVQALLRADDRTAAKAIVDKMSDEDYKLYKSILTAEHSANTTQLRQLVNIAPKEAVQFLQRQLPKEQKRLLNLLTDKEFEMLKAGKAELEAAPAPDEQASSGASRVLGALTGAKTAEAAAPGEMIARPRSPLDVLTGRTELVRPDAGEAAMGQKVDTGKILAAFAHNETGVIKKNPYGFSQPSGDKALGRALGKYQITEDLLKRHSPRYLGRAVSSEEFLKSPKLQDEFMANRIKYLMEQGYTIEQIADIHRHGSTNEPGSRQYKRPEYVKKFSTYLNR